MVERQLVTLKDANSTFVHPAKFYRNYCFCEKRLYYIDGPNCVDPAMNFYKAECNICSLRYYENYYFGKRCSSEVWNRKGQIFWEHHTEDGEVKFLTKRKGFDKLIKD